MIFSGVRNFHYPVVYYTGEGTFAELLMRKATRETFDSSSFETDREKYLSLLKF